MVKKIIFTLFAFIICCSDTFAYNSDLWENFILPDYVNLAEYSSETSFTTTTMAFQSDSTNANTSKQRAYFYDHMGGQSNDTFGTGISFPIVANLTQNYTYNASFILCSQSQMVVNYLNVGTANGSWQNSFSSPYVKVNDWTVITTKSFDSESTNFPMCRIVAVNFTANRGGNFLMLRFRSNSLSSFGNYFGFMGYQLDYEGQDYTTYLNNLESSLNNLSSSINNQFNDLNTNINNQSAQIQNGLSDIDGSINNSNIDNPDFEEFEDYLTENGVITQLITLPVQLYSKILNGINNSCTDFSLGTLFGTNLIMPCISPANYLGNNLWNTIDILFSGFFIYAISKKMVKVFEQFTNLKEGDILD